MCRWMDKKLFYEERQVRLGRNRLCLDVEAKATKDSGRGFGRPMSGMFDWTIRLKPPTTSPRAREPGDPGDRGELKPRELESPRFRRLLLCSFLRFFAAFLVEFSG